MSGSASPDGSVQIADAATDATQEAARVSLYAKHIKIYPRAVKKGWFDYWRWAFVWLTQLIYYGTPWLVWNNRQAVLFDLGARKFYIFGLILWPQDFIYLTGLLIISAYALFLFTAVGGRLFCGYACPQTVYTEIFTWIERQIEGNHMARAKRDKQPMSAEKLLRKGGTYTAWALLSLWTSFTFVGYFIPIHEFAHEVLTLSMSGWALFWLLFYAAFTMLQAGFMREQVCKYMCPYARFQSAMFDKDTLVVTYDTERGEPRGARGKKIDIKAAGLGSCVDCNICVQVCPTGIDIRKGLQYECIGCGACIDACDEVMDKMSYPRGLIRYTTEHAIQRKFTPKQMWRRVGRPRILLYTVGLCLITTAWGVSLWHRNPLKIDIIRDRAVMAREVAGGKLENVYQLRVMNTSEKAHRYHVSVEGLPGATVADHENMDVASATTRTFAISVDVSPEGKTPGTHRYDIVVSADDGSEKDREHAVFYIPEN